MRVKICGLRSRAEAAAAVSAGASYVGFTFFPPSPRNVSLADARWVAESVPEGVIRVALTVNADDAELEAIVANVPVEMLQLHGVETPERVAEIRARFGKLVMKAVGIAGEADVAALSDYARVADQILVDARVQDSSRPGGNGRAFDWSLIRNRRWERPWMLAGGLTPTNVGEAVRMTGAEQVDVSSGVEARPGYKDARLIAAFVRAARDAERLEA